MIGKVSKAVRFFVIIVSPGNQRVRKGYHFLFSIIFGRVVVTMWVAFGAYCLAWLVVSSDVRSSVYRICRDLSTRHKMDVVQMVEFGRVGVGGFPFMIDVFLDRAVFRSDFVERIEIKNLHFRYHVFGNERLRLVDVGEIVVTPNKNGENYVIAFNSKPRLVVFDGKNGQPNKIVYSDRGYRVVSAGGRVTDVVKKSLFEYNGALDGAKSKFAYRASFETVFEVGGTNIASPDAFNGVGEVVFAISLYGDDWKYDRRRGDSSVTINNLSLATPSFSINGYGSVLTGDKTTFKVNLEIKPYKAMTDFVANYLFSKKDLFVSKADVGRYYSAIRNVILPKMSRNVEGDKLKLLIVKDGEGDVSVNNLSMDYLFTILAAARYNVIYENIATRRKAETEVPIVQVVGAEGGGLLS